MIRHTWVSKSVKRNKKSVKYFRKRFVTDENTPQRHLQVPDMEIQIQLSENIGPSNIEKCLTADQSNNLPRTNSKTSNASRRKPSNVTFSEFDGNELNFDLSHECSDSNDIGNTPLRYSNSNKSRIMMVDQTNNHSTTNKKISIAFSNYDENEPDIDLIHEIPLPKDIGNDRLRYSNSKKIRITENCITEEQMADGTTHRRSSSPDTRLCTANESSVELEEDSVNLVQHYHPRIHLKDGAGKNMVGLAWVTLAIVLVFMICHSIKWIANFYEMIMVRHEYP